MIQKMSDFNIFELEIAGFDIFLRKKCIDEKILVH